MAKYCFGIDIGGTSIKLGLFNLAGVLLEKWEIPTRTEAYGERIIPDIAGSVKEKMREHSLGTAQVAGLGIGVPGQVDAAGTVLLAENLGWRNIPLSQILTEDTGIPVKTENDANLAALGELRQGSGRGCRNMMLVTVGTGIGCGIILDGAVVAGANGAAGEIGHIHVEDAVKAPCNCGNYGCLEQVASARGITMLAGYILEMSKEPSVLRGQSLSARRVFEAAKSGDKLAVWVVGRFGFYLGKALALCSCVIDPERIVIGGGVSGAGEIVVEYVQKYYRRYAFPACADTEFCLAKLGNDAGIYGAAELVIG